MDAGNWEADVAVIHRADSPAGAEGWGAGLGQDAVLLVCSTGENGEGPVVGKHNLPPPVPEISSCRCGWSPTTYS